MQIRLTQHAQQRMKERDISMKCVEDCLDHYQVSRPGDGDKTIYDYSENGCKISVSAVEENGILIVASVWRVIL